MRQTALPQPRFWIRLATGHQRPSPSRLSPRPLVLGRGFTVTPPWRTLRTQKLGDVGEGITECMLNMWFVEEGARVEEWDKLCEMQSDKAAVEISANYSGVVRKLHAQADDMVKTGAALVDIDDGVVGVDEEPAKSQSLPGEDGRDERSNTAFNRKEDLSTDGSGPGERDQVRLKQDRGMPLEADTLAAGARLATPAVRGLLKEHQIDVASVTGTGKNGRILKEDVQDHLRRRDPAACPSTVPPSPTMPHGTLSETAQALTAIQLQMYRAMTASLTIPHLLYTDEIDVSRLSGLRKRLNRQGDPSAPHLTLLPFVLKAVSVSLNQYPILNARIDTATDAEKPQLLFRRQHNIGIAMDTPGGLLVPVVRDVAALSVLEIGREMGRLSDLGQGRKLSPADLSGGTISVSNIGNIGGTVVAPVLVEGQVAILGMGRSRTVPVFGDSGVIEKAEVAHFSWSADHRVIDGATMARMAGVVKKLVEQPEELLVKLR